LKIPQGSRRQSCRRVGKGEWRYEIDQGCLLGPSSVSITFFHLNQRTIDRTTE